MGIGSIIPRMERKRHLRLIQFWRDYGKGNGKNDKSGFETTGDY